MSGILRVRSFDSLRSLRMTGGVYMRIAQDDRCIVPLICLAFGESPSLWVANE